MATWSWKRALLHAFIALMCMVGIGAVLSLITHPVDPERFGEGIGQFSAFICIGVFIASAVGQRGRRKLALAAIISLGVVVLAGAIAIVAFAHPHRALLAPADRTPLIAFDDSPTQHRLRHPTLGWSIAAPDSTMAPSPKFVELMTASNHGSDTLYYAYAQTPPSKVFIIGVLYDDGEDRDALQSAVTHIKHGIAQSIAGKDAAMAIAYVRDETTWNEHEHVVRVHAVVQNKVHFQLAAYALRRGRLPYIVVLMSIAPDADAFVDLLNSLRP